MYVFGKNVAYDTLMGKTTVKKCFLDKDFKDTEIISLLKQKRIRIDYLLKRDLDISKLHLQKEEVSEVKLLSYDEFKNLFYSSEFVPFDNEYRELVLKMLKANFN